MRNATPVDTARDQRGWVQATNQAIRGVLPPISLPPLRKSSYKDQIKRRLVRALIQARTRQKKIDTALAYWRRLNSTAPASFRGLSAEDKKNFRFARARTKKLTQWAQQAADVVRELERQLKELEGNDTAIVIGRRLPPGKDKAEQLKKLDSRAPAISHYDTIRTKIYGGRGSISQAGSTWVAELRNLEPHTSIVDANVGVVAQAKKAVGGMGKILSRTAVAKLQSQGVPGVRAG